MPAITWLTSTAPYRSASLTLTRVASGAMPWNRRLSAAYAAPASGQWGDAGRNSVTGPAQFGVDTSVARSFQWTKRLSLDWRIDATNVLNRETFSGVSAVVGGAQFGLPNVANTPRRLLSTMRLRF